VNIKSRALAQPTPPTSSRARARGAAVLLAAALALTACGSDKSTNSVVSDSGAAPTAAASDEATAAPDASASSAPSQTVKGAGAAKPGVPAVTKNATDLKKEPVIAAGTGDAPAKLVTRDLVVGTGTKAVASDTVMVRYVGALYTDGTVFDSSWKGGSASIEFPLSGVVPGFAQGIVGMKVGGRREIVIPSELGYGASGVPGIPPNSVLVFIVDLTKTGPA
jgi:FKBP-type peptidyl-prolyl cis-trans isomerase